MRNIFTIICACILSLSLSAQSKAYAPELSSPADSATNIMTVTLLDWEPIAGYLNLSYEIEVADNVDFNDAIKLSTIQTAIHTPTLKFNTTYFWRVRAIDDQPGHNVSDWSEVWIFTTFRNVVLNAPANNYNTLQSPRTIIRWKTQTSSEKFYGIEKFEVMFSPNEDMSDATHKIIDFSKLDNSTLQALDTLDNLTFNQVYFWNVRAFNNAEGSYADSSDWADAPFTFQVVNEPATNKPQLKNNKNVDVDPNVSLELKNEYSPIIYQFQIAEDENFDNVVALVDATTKNCEAPALYFGKTYYWRARHSYANTFSDWSFTDEKVWWFSVISKPNLKSPANGLEIGAGAEFTWQSIPTTEYYTLEVSTNSNFLENETREFTITPPSTNIVKITMSTINSFVNAEGTYYWRIKSFHHTFDGTAEFTQWSDVRSFNYNPTGISSVNNLMTSVYPNPSNGSFTIEVANDVKSAIVTVYDLVGKIQFQDNLIFDGQRQTLNLNIKKGLYILEINHNGMKANKKITVL